MRRVALAALVVGVIAGALAAVAVPREREPARRPLRTAPALTGTTEGAIVRGVPGSARVVARGEDPDGGSPWVLRTFSGRQHFPNPDPRLSSRDTGGRRFCVQLLREVDGKLGWIDGTNTFRPVALGDRGAPVECTSALPGPTTRPVLSGVTLVADIDRPDAARTTRTVAYAFGGRGVSRAAMTLGKQRRQVDASPAGGVIAFAPPSVVREQLAVRFDYRGGGRQAVDLGDEFREPPRPRGAGRRPRPRPRSVDATIDARAADPNGGLAWAVGAVPDTTGGWCVQSAAGRVVGDTVGMVDFDLGTIWPGALRALQCRDRVLDKVPAVVTYAFGGGALRLPGADPERGRIARRTLPGKTSVYGRVREDVTAVTITTPRDVRTLAPSPRAHAFLAVYDGDFPTGEIVVTVHFRDGTSKVADRFKLGGL